MQVTTTGLSFHGGQIKSSGWESLVLDNHIEGTRCAVISHLPAYVVKNSLINAGLVQYFRAG